MSIRARLRLSGGRDANGLRRGLALHRRGRPDVYEVRHPANPSLRYLVSRVSDGLLKLSRVADGGATAA